MMAEGITVKVDLIIGLPGDTVDSVRRGFHYLHENGLFNDLQVFNLSILPGTAFRQEAGALGLKFQPRPPYYVLRTPTLAREDLYGLMQEAQELFDIDFDAQPPPVLDFGSADSLERVWRVDLDDPGVPSLESCRPLAQAFTIWMRSSGFDHSIPKASACISKVLKSEPFATLQVVLEPTGPATPGALSRRTLEALMAVCQARPTYLDRYYALQPGSPNGAKRLVVLLPDDSRTQFDDDWIEEIGTYATIVWSPAPAAKHEKLFI